MFSAERSFPQLRRWIIYATINLFIVSVLGVALRYKAIFAFPLLDYKYLLNAHSHFAFSGWITTALFTALLYILTASGVRLSSVYRYQFWLNQLSSFGMLVSFICQGYGAISILFSSISVLFSYWFAIRYLHDSKKALWPPVVRRCIQLALLFLVLSSAGPYLLAYSMSHHIGSMSFYYNAIYLYLHFQYNGWFSFGVISLFFWSAFRCGSPAYQASGRAFVWLMGIACIPAYCLSLLWTDPPAWVWVVGTIAVLLQAAALIVLLVFIVRNNGGYRSGSVPAATRIIWGLALAAFIIKLTLQALSVIPRLGSLAFSHRSVIIAYLHLVVLGFVTFMLLGFFISQGLLTLRAGAARTGLLLFIVGVALNEFLLLIQSLMQFSSMVWGAAGYCLLGAALVMSAGALLVSGAQLLHRPQS
ncbi:MAG TPA: hypothetical protein VHD83_02215 [Puia sp.]|nr:hypothetical protein [Puia sp.]